MASKINTHFSEELKNMEPSISMHVTIVVTAPRFAHSQPPKSLFPAKWFD